MKTPSDIVPTWYYTPFYAMLRSATYPLFGLTAKFLGLLVMGGAILIPFAVPWLDKSPVRSIRYKGVASKIFLALMVISLFILGYLGTQKPTPRLNLVAEVCTMLYYAYFLLMPWYTKVEKTKPVPERLPG